MSTRPAPTVTSGSVPGLVHGMERDELCVADWPALTDDEVRRVLARLGDAPSSAAHDVRVLWCSPRPMSAAALVRRGDTELFVKRHHVAVRGPDRLRLEHGFAEHLRRRGQRVARVLADADGDTVLGEGEYFYEVQEKAPGVDLYREQPSWYPFFTRAHARSAGRVLARLHEAARDFAAPASAPGVLTNSTDV
ncbi:MAG: phosphotransferase, partial [Acidobacteria bacterium]|nr:phosphotransferase [Acidobacteriota bacterium]